MYRQKATPMAIEVLKASADFFDNTNPLFLAIFEN